MKCWTPSSFYQRHYTLPHNVRALLPNIEIYTSILTYVSNNPRASHLIDQSRALIGICPCSNLSVLRPTQLPTCPSQNPRPHNYIAALFPDVPFGIHPMPFYKDDRRSIVYRLPTFCAFIACV